MKVYDCFLFFNELNLLEARLNILNDIVDKFVLVESTVTFSGNPKPLYFNENKQRFEKFLDKIIHVVVDDTPNNYMNFDSLYVSNNSVFNNILDHLKNAHHIPKNEPQWCREFFQRECMIRGLQDCSQEDVIIFSDLDEIPNPENINLNISNDSIYHCDQSMYQYFVNIKKDERWFGSKIFKYSYLVGKSLNSIRTDKNRQNVLQNCGWHLTFLGGVENIKLKIQSYGHQELNRPDVLNSLDSKIRNNQDIFYRPDRYFDIDFENEFPEFVKKELLKYPEFFK